MRNATSTPLVDFISTGHELGIKYLRLAFDHTNLSDGSRAYYPLLRVHRASSESGSTVTKDYEDISIDPAKSTSCFTYAVKRAFRCYLKTVNMADSEAEKTLEDATAYIKSDAFSIKLWEALTAKSKTLPNGLKSVRFYSDWISNGSPIGLSFGIKRENGHPTLEANYSDSSNDVFFKKRFHIHRYYHLFNLAAYLTAKLLALDTAKREDAEEYSMAVYWMLKGEWLTVAHHCNIDNIDDDILRYQLNHRHFLERVSVELLLINPECSALSHVKFNEKTELQSIASKNTTDIFTTHEFNALVNSFKNGFTVRDIKDSIPESLGVTERYINMMIRKYCRVKGYVDGNPMLERVYEAQ
ncbi:hypothetical protein [Vibrio anguillarum]|nr:hypothetical protein [Vibrio anguillarum]